MSSEPVYNQPVIVLVGDDLKFSPGTLYATPGALQALKEAGEYAGVYLHRHVHGDWGDVCPADGAANDWDLAHGGRLISVYTTRLGVKIWVITEWDRSATTLLLPAEY